MGIKNFLGNISRLPNFIRDPRLAAILNPGKLALIDQACRQSEIASIADLGGGWKVDGGYTFYALEHWNIPKGILVDLKIPPAVLRRKDKFPGLTLIEGSFGDTEVAKQIGEVDAVLLFDVLLHQVKPDWDEILKLYAPLSRLFLIFNQQYVSSEHTVRLMDLGEAEYFKNVPYNPNDPKYKDLFRNIDAIHPTSQKPYRDMKYLWQWGITDCDLVDAMDHLGFSQVYYYNWGSFGKLKSFENHAFIFHKR